MNKQKHIWCGLGWVFLTLLLAGAFGGSLYGFLYFNETIPDDSIPTCLWVEDVFVDGCIHHRIFLLSSEKNISTRIYSECVLDSPFQENATYWCKLEGYDIYFYQPYFSQPTKYRSDSGTIMLLIPTITFGFFYILVIIISYFSYVKEMINSTPAERHTEKRVGERKVPNERKRRSSRQKTPRNDEGMEMPRWEV